MWSCEMIFYRCLYFFIPSFTILMILAFVCCENVHIVTLIDHREQKNQKLPSLCVILVLPML